MSSYRPYRSALGIERALEELSRSKGSLYDTDAVLASVKLFSSQKFKFKALAAPLGNPFFSGYASDYNICLMSEPKNAEHRPKESPEVVAELIGASKTFKSGSIEIVALQKTDLRLRSGELLLIIGPSGSGKTTLLSLLGCVLYPSEG